jgi:hypothetical protein
MDAESLQLLKAVLVEGITSASWRVLLLAIVGAGLGAFLGAYLKRKGEDRALRENFSGVLNQMKQQTEITEQIKSEFATRLESMKAERAETLVKITEQIKSFYAQDAFVRELYIDPLRQYCHEQAYALRQAYLLLYEPASSSSGSEKMALEARLDMATQLVMEPLRKHIIWLDEATHRRITDVHNKILDMKGRTTEEFNKKKIDIFNETDTARQFVKVDRVAYRLGLIGNPLSLEGRGERDEQNASKESA